MSAVVSVKEEKMHEIECQYCPNPHCPGEGYYRVQTTDGEFLCNVGVEELDYELSLFRQSGYSLSRIVGERRYDGRSIHCG